MKFKFFLPISFILFTGVFSFWFFGSPGEATSVTAYKEWDNDRQLTLSKQRLMSTEILDEKFRYDSLELVYVGPGKPYFSWWGHLLIRFVGSGSSSDKDFALGFVADFNDFPLDKYKGLMGGYTVMPKIDTIDNFFHEYVENHGRDFVRYALTSSQLQRDKLLRNLREWLKDPTLPGTYSFAQNNCVGLMAKLLDQSGFQGMKEHGYFPKGFISNLTDAQMARLATENSNSVKRY